MTLGLCFAQMALPAHAEPVSAVVLLRMPRGAQRGTEDRTRDELRLMGIHVEEVKDPRTDAEIDQIMSETGAIAAIRLEPAGGAYDAVAWFHDGSAVGEVTAHRFTGLPGESSLVALKLAETVRRRVIELQSVSGPIDPVGGLQSTLVGDPPFPEPVLLPPPPVIVEPLSSLQDEKVRLQPFDMAWHAPDELDVWAPPAPKVQTPARRTIARGLSLGVSAAMAGKPGEAQYVIGGSLTLGWHVLPMLTLQAELGALATPVSIRVSHGSLQLGLASTQFFIALGLPGERRIMPQMRLGGGPVVAWATGRGSRELSDGLDLGVTAAVTGGVGIAVRVSPRFHLSLGLDLQILTRAVGVRLYGDVETQLGPPLTRGRLGFAWDFTRRTRPM